MTAATGIDFGTSNSSVAVSAGGRPRLLPLQADATSVPTALFFSFEDNSVTHGREAMQRYLSGEQGRLLRSIKSLLGTPLFNETTQVKTKRYTFAEIIAHFLRFLRTSAGRELGREPESVVIGRPAFFVDDDSAADAEAEAQLAAAAKAAGFSAIEFQYEPIAAALDYEQSVAGEEIAMVADIGGGTSDFSLVRVSPQLAGRSDRQGDILAWNGVHIGGTDFDRQLSMATLMPFLGYRSLLKTKGMSAPSWYFADLATWHRVNAVYEPRVLTEMRGVWRDAAEPEKIERLMRVVERRLGHDLLGRVERAKIALSGKARTNVLLRDIADELALEIERGELDSAIAEGLERIGQRAKELVKAAGVDPKSVRTLFLTGGSSGVPAVRAAIRKAVPKAKVVTGDAFGSVATGLAIDAARRFGPR